MDLSLRQSHFINGANFPIVFFYNLPIPVIVNLTFFILAG